MNEIRNFLINAIPLATQVYNQLTGTIQLETSQHKEDSQETEHMTYRQLPPLLPDCRNSYTSGTDR